MKKANAWPSINPSELRHSVQIQAQSATQDASGQEQLTWDTVVTTRAKIEALTEAQLYQQSQISAQVTHTVTIRYTSTPLTAGMRVLFAGRNLKIQTQPENVQERNLLLILRCLEVAGL